MIVADSAFSSFKTLCKDVMKQYSPKLIPNCLISCLFPCFFTKLKTDVKRKANYDVEDLNILDAVRRINQQTAIVFISGNNDELVNYRNSEILFKNFKGKNKYL